jgi:hypothetical protein
LPPPSLDYLFALNGFIDVIESLVPNELRKIVLAREAREDFVLML